jgi:hypothetical protein
MRCVGRKEKASLEEFSNGPQSEHYCGDIFVKYRQSIGWKVDEMECEELAWWGMIESWQHKFGRA